MSFRIRDALAAMAAAALISAAPGAHAQDSATTDPDEPVTLEEVVVIGRSLEEATASFVEDIAAPPSARGLARWNRPVCFGVLNLQREVAEHLLENLTAAALEFGVAVQDAGCQPDVLIIATDDGPGFSDRLVDATYRLLFRPGAGATRIGQPPSVLEHFRTSDDPVRWWQISLPTDTQTGMIMVRFPGDLPKYIRVDSVSQMRGRIRDDLKRILIVVDVDAASSVSVDQLSAYLAMVSLAQIDAISDKRGHSTILNLFAADQAPPGLTDWDRAYLTSLYNADDGRIRAFERASFMAEDFRADSQPNGPARADD